MSTLRYPPHTVAMDLLRGSAGCLLTGAPLVVASPPAWLAITLALGLALFVVYTVDACLRVVRRYRLDAQGVSVEPGGEPVRWADLDALDLSYYSTRRDGREGWLQLRLAAGRRVLRMDSRLAGFEQLVAQALGAARQRHIAMSNVTRSNLEALGLEPGEEGS